jgi:hypothetical protein
MDEHLGCEPEEIMINRKGAIGAFLVYYYMRCPKFITSDDYARSLQTTGPKNKQSTSIT